MPHAQPQRPATRLRSSGQSSRRVAVVAMALAGLATMTAPAAAEPPAAAAVVVTAPRLQKLVDDMRKAMAITHDVAAEVVADNPLKASVEPVKGGAGGFRLAIDQRFLEQLSEEELSAVVAHELGHVWIYTHFPYLQTEQLANQIAMRIVTRDSLDRVYGKVWADASSAGSLPRFPEERSVTVAAELATPRPEN